MARRILITGASGLLGAHLAAALSRECEVTGVDRHPWWGDEPIRLIQEDLTTAPAAAARLIREAAPDVVIHCAAMTNVDACEQEPARAEAVNAGLTRAIAHTLPASCLLVYISTDGVLSGEAACSTEEAVPAPRTAYGRSKLEGERAVLSASDRHLVVRTNFYGWSSGRKRTAGEWLYGALADGQPITLFHDIYFTPIYVMDVVDALQALIARRGRGLVHVGGRDRVSKEQFGRLMAELGGFSAAQARSGSVEQAPLAASRPKDTSLSSARYEQAAGRAAPSCRDGLLRFLADQTRPLSRRVLAGDPQPRAGAPTVQA